VSPTPRTYTHGVDTHRLSSSEALAWARRGRWSRDGVDVASAPEGAWREGAPVLRPHLDESGLRILVRRQDTLWARVVPVVFLGVMMSTLRLHWTWTVATLVVAFAVLLLVGAARDARERRLVTAVEAGGPAAVLLATCRPARHGWRLDLASTDAPDHVVASLRRPVLGVVVARFADQEVTRTASPENLRRAPWRAWAAEPVLVLDGPSAKLVTAVRAPDGGPWIVSRARRSPARDARVAAVVRHVDQQGARA
jgi:hypothetical protein